MCDPYDILGVTRGASLDEIKAAYRRACKLKHPDMGGSHEAMSELNTAYAFILNELKRDYQGSQQGAPQYERADGDSAREQDTRSREKTYRDIDDELEELRRAAQAHEETLRNMRAEAWRGGDQTTWAKLTFDDLSRSFRSLFNSGLKGIAVLFAALIGVGSVFVETNFVSGLVILGSGLGFFLSLALKSDKGGVMSAGLLLFGLMTIWLPPVRAALFAYPLATVSVLACLALIFKFGQHGGIVGLMTGGVLTLFVIGAIFEDTGRQEREQPRLGPLVHFPKEPTARAPDNSPALSSPAARPASQATPSPAHLTSPPLPTQPRTLIAAPGSMLKFVAGVPYHLKIRTGRTTTLRAVQGLIALYADEARIGECTDILEFPMQSHRAPYAEIGNTIRACGEDVVAQVESVD